MGALTPTETVRALELLLPPQTHPSTDTQPYRTHTGHQQAWSERQGQHCGHPPPLPETLASLGPLQGRSAQPLESGRYVPPFLKWARGGETGTSAEMGECRGVTHVWGTPPRFTGQRCPLPGRVQSSAQTHSLPGFLPVLGARAPDTQSWHR